MKRANIVVFAIIQCIMACLCFSIQAYAAVARIPATVEPGRISQEITPITPTPPPARPEVSQPPVQARFTDKIAAMKFKIRRFILKGNTLYNNKELMTLFHKKLNTTITLGDVQKFANAITIKYNKAGYVLSQAVIPAQTIKNGIVRIQIIEGFVNKVTVKGDVSPQLKSIIKSYGDKVLRMKPLNINELESSLLLANDLPGVQVKSVLSASKKTKYASDLTLLVIHKIVDSSSYIDYDNRGTRYIGPTRTILSAYLNTILKTPATSGIKIASSGQWREMRFVELQHKQFFGHDGLSINIDGQYTRTEPGFLLQGTNTIGTSKYFILGAQYPITRLRRGNLYINAAFNYVNSAMDQFHTKVYNDQIRTLQLGVLYEFMDQYRGSTQLIGTFTQGLDFLGASQPGNLVSRIGAKPVFSKLNLTGGRLQGLFRNFSLMLTANGQYTNSKMYAYQQIGYGGLPFGDAYDPSEIIADRGIEAKIELRSDGAFPFNKIPTQYFVYFDGGVLWNIDHINQKGRQTGTSAGFGVRGTALSHVNFSLELAKPLDRDVAATAAIPGGTENPRAWRGFFTLTVAP